MQNKNDWLASKLIIVALILLSTLGLYAALSWNQYQPVDNPGSRISIEGTSTLHAWMLESNTIEGFARIDPTIPADAVLARSQTKTGKVAAQAEIVIPVASLHSVRNGKPFSSQMDKQAYAKLKKNEYPSISFKLTDATLDYIPENNDASFTFTAKGQLTIAGVTKLITLPLEIQLLKDNQVKVSGATSLKMSEYGISPPDLVLMKVGDEVKIRFGWLVKRS
jgi:hypothetical protein